MKIGCGRHAERWTNKQACGQAGRKARGRAGAGAGGRAGGRAGGQAGRHTGRIDCRKADTCTHIHINIRMLTRHNTYK